MANKVERHGFARRTGRRRVAGHLISRMAEWSVSNRDHRIMLFDFTQGLALPAPVEKKEQRSFIQVIAQP